MTTKALSGLGLMDTTGAAQQRKQMLHKLESDRRVFARFVRGRGAVSSSEQELRAKWLALADLGAAIEQAHREYERSLAFLLANSGSETAA